MDLADVEQLKAALEKELAELLGKLHRATNTQRQKLIKDSLELTKLIEALASKRYN